MDNGDQQYTTTRITQGDGAAPRRPPSPVQPNPSLLLPVRVSLINNEDAGEPSTQRNGSMGRRLSHRSPSSASGNTRYHTPLPHRHGSSGGQPPIKYIYVSISARNTEQYPPIQFMVRQDSIPYLHEVSPKLHGFFLDCINMERHVVFTESTEARASMLELVIRRGCRIAIDGVESPYADFDKQVALAEILWRHGCNY